MTTTKELDRLVSKTYLTPIKKQALREVRRAALAGRASDPVLGEADWEISIGTRGGSNVSFRFAWKKVS